MLIFQGDVSGTNFQHAAIRHELVDASQLAVDQGGGVLGTEEDRFQFQPVEDGCFGSGRRNWNRRRSGGRWRREGGHKRGMSGRRGRGLGFLDRLARQFMLDRRRQFLHDFLHFGLFGPAFQAHDFQPRQQRQNGADTQSEGHPPRPPWPQRECRRRRGRQPDEGRPRFGGRLRIQNRRRDIRAKAGWRPAQRFCRHGRGIPRFGGGFGPLLPGLEFRFFRLRRARRQLSTRASRPNCCK